MPWPIDTASTIFGRMASRVEQRILTLAQARGLAVTLAKVSLAVRSAQGVIANLLSPIAGEIRNVHEHQAWWGRQYMPDSADDEEMILRHANIWGVEGRAAIKALGDVMFEGAAGTVLASGIPLTAGNGQAYVTTAGGTIPGGGAITLSAEAVTAGAGGNLAAGIVLSTDAVIDGVTRVSVANPFSGGADAETPAEIQVAYLRRIRTPPMGGAAQDYSAWVAEVADVYAVKPVEDWIGRGSVGVVVALANADGTPRTPTTPELETIGAHLGLIGSQTGVRPVTARTIPVAASLADIPISVRLRPDTSVTRAAVSAAYQRFILTIGDEDDDQNTSPIGALIEPSRISEAISSSSGEYAHDLTSPAAPFTLDRAACPVAGAITWLD
ncbi:baseplate J/gp47 family protein [Rhizobium sp. SL86]|uniref:baseplate J/gp47 family protein n=1 Tax=Rhizobium sp. SL86 TaxID=2995148 RepID=UPI0022761F3E|nr:baseplate J/gp47 family protein [Rhizobium sp. SL86]MCY1666235.1 baseplate J/gp47 family protein [Rhizobium sp. SL86]